MKRGVIFDSYGSVQTEDEDLFFLKQNFLEGPQTYGWPGEINYRFSQKGIKISVWYSKKNGSEGHRAGFIP